PLLLRAEISTYRALATPPGYVRRAFTGFQTGYSSLWIQPYRETAGVPPLQMTLEHVTWALPLWFILSALIYEVVRKLSRMRPLERKAGYLSAAPDARLFVWPAASAARTSRRYASRCPSVQAAHG